MQCHANALIKKSDYCQMIIKLVALNYKYISIDADILIEAARLSNLHSAGYLGQKIIFAGGRTKKLQN